MKKYCLALITLVLFSSVWLFGKDFWEKPFTGWKHKDVVKLLKDSPWAQETTATSQWGGRGGTRDSGTATGEREQFRSMTMRFFTALPIRQGYVRMMLMMNKYDELSGAQKEELEQRFSRPITMDFSDQIIVAVEFASNDRQLNMQVDRALKTSTAETLKQGAYLISDRLGRVQIKAYHPPSPDGTGAKFVFPREVDGKPVASPDDKEIKFELYMPGTGEKMFIVKKIKKMIYNGKLEL